MILKTLTRYSKKRIHKPTLKSVRVTDAYYVLQVKEVSNKRCFPYFSTIEDIRRGDCKGTTSWLKKFKNTPGYKYNPTKELRYCYYVDFECTQRIANEVELFDLPVEDELGTRRIYRWVENSMAYELADR